MNYQLPGGYTFVDAGIRLGDNAGISYYELKERKATLTSDAKATMGVFAAVMMIFPGGGMSIGGIARY